MNSFEIEISDKYKDEIILVLNKLDKSAITFVIKKFEIYEKRGFLGCCLKNDIKDFGNGLYEIRIKYKGIALRFLGGYRNNTFNIVSILNKKTQKTPLSEIYKALKRI